MSSLRSSQKRGALASSIATCSSRFGELLCARDITDTVGVVVVVERLQTMSSTPPNESRTMNCSNENDMKTKPATETHRRTYIMNNKNMTRRRCTSRCQAAARRARPSHALLLRLRASSSIRCNYKRRIGTIQCRQWQNLPCFTRIVCDIDATKQKPKKYFDSTTDYELITNRSIISQHLCESATASRSQLATKRL